MSNKKYIYLDTNAFQLLVSSEEKLIKFKIWLNENKVIPVISSAGVSEISKTWNKFNHFNKFIEDFNFTFFGSYSRISDLEKKYYPKGFDIEEISLNEQLKDLKFNLNELLYNQKFQNSLILQSVYSQDFVKRLKEEIKKGKNIKEIMDNTKNRLSNELKRENIDINYFKTDIIINKFVFKKHLLQKNRKDEEGDFVDIQHIAFSPYMNYFVTDAENYEILKQIKYDKNSNILINTLIMNISKFKSFLNLT